MKKKTFKKKLNKYLEDIKANKKKLIYLLLIVVIIFGLGYLLKKTVFKSAPKKIYDVMIMPRDKNGPTSSALKYGDVVLARETGRAFSTGEKSAYLLIKMELSEEEYQKITKPKEKSLSEEEIDKEMKAYIENMPPELSDEDMSMYREELENRKQTLVMREYRINMEKYFKDFELKKLATGEANYDEVYTWKIVEKKD